MNSQKYVFALIAAVVVSTSWRPSIAQSAQAGTPIAATAATPVPALVPFSGTLSDANGKPISAETAITFLIFRDQTGGEPLFGETQEVTSDSNGHYRIQLGATMSSGLPGDLFASGEARWLEIQPAGQVTQPRVLIASVPYALKAADATTLGGLPVSAFVLADTTKPAEGVANVVPSNAITAGTTTANQVTTIGGQTGYIPMFSGAASIADSDLFQNATGVGIGTAKPATPLDVNGETIIRGKLDVFPAGTATPAAGASSNLLMIWGQAYNSNLKTTVGTRFAWQVAPVGNNTTTPSGVLNLLESNSTAGVAPTGLSINANGTINFAPGQTFPGAAAGTITAVTAGTGLTGGGLAGNVTLNLDTTKVPLLGAASNSFTGSQTIGGSLGVSGGEMLTGNLATPGTVSAGQVQASTGSFTGNVQSGGLTLPPLSTAQFAAGVNSNALDLQGSVYGYFDPSAITTDFRLQTESSYNGLIATDQSSLNLLFGSSTASPSETGFSIASNGTVTAPSVVTPQLNVSQPPGSIISAPVMVIQADDNGGARTAAQQLSIQGATIPGQQLLIGYISHAGTNSDGGLATIQATWNGYTNTALALQPNGGCVCIRTGVPGALAYANGPLVVGQGAGVAVADGWATYSSRRFKTNIETLNGALDKVERLRGVSYTLKATGKREIGVIAEEVGQVVPEVVNYEANGKDARSVDYTRLTALLIEAVKQQQAEIAAQQAKGAREEAELANAMRQIKLAQERIRRQSASISSLRTQVRRGEQAAWKVRQQVADRQFSAVQTTLVAAR